MLLARTEPKYQAFVLQHLKLVVPTKPRKGRRGRTDIKACPILGRNETSTCNAHWFTMSGHEVALEIR